jgi:hypothetical protein
MLGEGVLPTERKNEIDDAVRALDRRIVTFAAPQGSESEAQIGTDNGLPEPPVAIGDRARHADQKVAGDAPSLGPPAADSR